jgi:hypothetical protein
LWRDGKGGQGKPINGKAGKEDDEEKNGMGRPPKHMRDIEGGNCGCEKGG